MLIIMVFMLHNDDESDADYDEGDGGGGGGGGGNDGNVFGNDDDDYDDDDDDDVVNIDSDDHDDEGISYTILTSRVPLSHGFCSDPHNILILVHKYTPVRFLRSSYSGSCYLVWFKIYQDIGVNEPLFMPVLLSGITFL